MAGQTGLCYCDVTFVVISLILSRLTHGILFEMAFLDIVPSTYGGSYLPRVKLYVAFDKSMSSDRFKGCIEFFLSVWTVGSVRKFLANTKKFKFCKDFQNTAYDLVQ